MVVEDLTASGGRQKTNIRLIPRLALIAGRKCKAAFTSHIPPTSNPTMKLTLRPEWRPRALSSLIGFIELKTGVRIAILFAMLNKVAGIYGLITVFTGGNLAQLSMYTYSVVGLAAYVWGLKAVKEVSLTASYPRRPPHSNLFAGGSQQISYYSPFLSRGPRPEHHLANGVCRGLVALQSA